MEPEHWAATHQGVHFGSLTVSDTLLDGSGRHYRFVRWFVISSTRTRERLWCETPQRSIHLPSDNLIVR